MPDREEGPPEGEPEDAPLRRFEQLLGRLLAVPKAEVDRRRRQLDARRRRAAKTSGRDTSARRD